MKTKKNTSQRCGSTKDSVVLHLSGMYAAEMEKEIPVILIQRWRRGGEKPGNTSIGPVTSKMEIRRWCGAWWGPLEALWSHFFSSTGGRGCGSRFGYYVIWPRSGGIQNAVGTKSTEERACGWAWIGWLDGWWDGPLEEWALTIVRWY